jgi:phospholipid transport system transporter-binding protein
MSGQLSWTRDGETLALHGELDQDLLVPLWEARAQATAGTAIIDLSQTTRVDTADKKGRVALWQGEQFVPVK